VRILFVTSVSSSHLTPMVPLAWALRAAGHEVRVACDAGTAPGVLSVGLAAVVVGDDTRFAERHREAVTGVPGRRSYREQAALPAMFADNALAVVDELVAVAGTWRPHAVVHEPVAFAAEVVASALDVPAVRHLWGPDVFGTPPGRWLLSGVHGRLAGVFARYAGREPVLRRLVLDPCPTPMQELGPGVPVPIRHVAVDRPGPVPGWLLDAAPGGRICLTWGTFADGVPGEHPLLRVLHELSDLYPEVLLAVGPGDAARLGALPRAVRPVSGVPLHAVLPACSAVVHHGGANTMLGAVGRGLPQLVVSDSFEQGLNGQRLAGTGAGLHLGAEASTAAIRAAVERLVVDADLAGAAAALRDGVLSRPTPGQVAGDFADLLRRARAAAPTQVG
jgi:UDP:flavonoid glycosyltransferase YjiC (YdhE family)